jgi:hypothetical protein
MERANMLLLFRDVVAVQLKRELLVLPRLLEMLLRLAVLLRMD